MGPHFIFPAGLAFHLFIIKRIPARNCREYFQRRVALHDREKFCETSGYIRSEVSQNGVYRARVSALGIFKRGAIVRGEMIPGKLYEKCIFRRCCVRATSWSTLYTRHFENDNEIHGTSIDTGKYHLISSMHLIAQLFLIFIYLFTSLVSCLMTNIAHVPLQMPHWMRYK